MKALILAAGKGTRLKELTHDRPKPMLPVSGRPLLVYLVEWLRQYGVTEIAINLHHKPEAITDALGDGSNLGVSIVYSYETRLLGTAGAAKRLSNFLDEPFVLVYGDVYTNLDLARLAAFHEAQRAALTEDQPSMSLALYRVKNPHECGLVELDDRGRVMRFVEKPPMAEVFTDLANAGMCIADPGILAYVPSETPYDFGHHLLPKLLKIGMPVFGQELEAGEFLIDIGTPAGLALANGRADAVVLSKLTT